MLNGVTDFQCSASSVSVESYLENGRKLLAAGQLADALTQYHAAVGQLQICTYVFMYTNNSALLINCIVKIQKFYVFLLVTTDCRLINN